jgi:hypothetical protein
VIALVCAGCADDGPIGNTGSIQVVVDPAVLSVPLSGTGSVTASLTRGGGFSGPVSLAIAGLPAGVTTTITPAQLSGTTASASVDVTVGSAVPLGAYTATITATAQGVGQATATYQVTVTAAPDYALTVAPTELTIVGGSSNTATVTIDRTSFTGEVALALLNPPAGITGAFTPTPTTTDESELVVSVAANVAAGSYPLTIQGTATGPGVKTTTLTVTVPAPPTVGNVEYLFCTVGDIPVFFAYQDGAGPWQVVTGVASGGATRYAFTLAQGYGGVLSVYLSSAAAVTGALTAGRMTSLRPVASRRAPGVSSRSSFADGYETYLLHGSTAELAQDGQNSCAQEPPTKTVTGTVLGVPAGEYGRVSLGGVTRIFDGAASSNPITFSDVPAGAVDLLGSRAIPGAAPDRVIVVRNLNVADGGALPSVIDFNGPGSSVPATATVTITGAAGADIEVYTDVVRDNRPRALWADLSPSPATTRPWAGLGPAVLLSGEFHELVVFASASDGTGDFRVSLKDVGPVTNQTIAFGPPINMPTASQVVAGAYPRFRFQGALPAEYSKGASIDVYGSDNVFFILATGAYLTASGSALAYDVTMPDVAGLAGFPGAARLTAGSNDVVASGFGFTGPGTFEPLPALGGEYKASIRNATIVVP